MKRDIRKEQNLILEGRNIDIFRRNMQEEPTIKTPLVYWDYTTEKILVTEYIHGIKISNLQDLDKAGIDREQVAKNGTSSILKQIFEHGFFHADPHPGNIIVPIDFGMMGRAMVISESVGVKLYPEFNLFDLLIPYTKGIFFDRFNPLVQYWHILRILEQTTDFLKNLPEDIQNILLKIKNDRLSINFQHQGLEDFTRELDRSSNRIAFAMVIASLIIGSSLVIQLDKSPFIWDYPALGVVGYILASVFGIWLLISILRSGKL